VVGAVGLGRRPEAAAPVAAAPVAAAPVAATAVPAEGAAEPVVVERAYPARLDGDLQPDLSRWLWLVKWILVIPHAIVLVFLWIAFVVLSAVAFFAILFTGRYPRGIFDFNLGVLRWSWRVGFYSYSALGTDRYPPFSLDEVPDYPARFDVDYPEQLSRGLVLVKWWLLAIPHYLIIALFGSGWWWGRDWNDDVDFSLGGGLIGILVFIAAVWLLFSGRYPRELFNVVMGFNRWVFRVVAYASLMRDEYPPFRLDQGPRDPGTPEFVEVEAPSEGRGT
jgi:hypothetical protein